MSSVAILPDGRTLASAGGDGMVRLWKGASHVDEIVWNTSAWFAIINGDRKFGLVTEMGTVRCFDLSTGKLLDPSDRYPPPPPSPPPPPLA